MLHFQGGLVAVQRGSSSVQLQVSVSHVTSLVRLVVDFLIPAALLASMVSAQSAGYVTVPTDSSKTQPQEIVKPVIPHVSSVLETLTTVAPACFQE